MALEYSALLLRLDAPDNKHAMRSANCDVQYCDASAASSDCDVQHCDASAASADCDGVDTS